jgi:hypothetical protein
MHKIAKNVWHDRSQCTLNISFSNSASYRLTLDELLNNKILDEEPLSEVSSQQQKAGQKVIEICQIKKYHMYNQTCVQLLPTEPQICGRC